MCFKIRNSRYMQYLSAITATLSNASAATYSVWASPSLIKLQSEESPIGRPISDEEGSWIVSAFLIGSIPAPLIAAPMVEKMGRKKTLVIGGILLFAPWFMIIFGNSIVWLYIGRTIAGIGTGLTSVACPIYTGEIAENDIRGKLGTTFIVLKLVGTMIVLSTGPYVSYTTLGIISASVSLVFLLMFPFMPESPYYLTKVYDKENAEKTVRTLSKKAIDDTFIHNRLLEIDYTVQADMKNKTTVWEFFSKKEYRKALILNIVIKTLHQFSGTAAINAYMQTIIELTGSNISSELSSLIFAFIQLPAVLAASFLIDGIGRRPILIFSALGCALALLAEGVYFYLQDVLEADVSKLAWLPTTALGLFLIMNSLGVVTIPFVLLGEMFPTNIKGIAVSTISIYGGITAFLVAKFFMPISNAWGIYTMFWMFASICILGSIYVFIFLPETKGRTFIEIQHILQKGRSKKDVLTYNLNKLSTKL